MKRMYFVSSVEDDVELEDVEEVLDDNDEDIGLTTDFLLSYIKKQCIDGNVNDLQIKELISKYIKNISEREFYQKNDIEELKKQIKNDMLNDSIDESESIFKKRVLKDRVVQKLSNVNLQSELIEYMKKSDYCPNLSLREIIAYILSKYDIVDLNKEINAAELFKLSSASLDEFVNFLVTKHFNDKSFALSGNDVIMSCYDEDGGYIGNEYDEKYSSLAKACLFKDLKSDVTMLIDEYSNNQLFTNYLKLLLNSLSNYDLEFQKQMSIDISPKVATSLVRTNVIDKFGDDLDYYIEDNELQKKALIDILEDEYPHFIGKLEFKDIMESLPEDYVERLYSSYDGLDPDSRKNKYAVLLSKIVAKYCATRDGQKYTPGKVQAILLNKYKQIIEQLSKNMENDETHLKR